jgi:hypothetical protein
MFLPVCVFCTNKNQATLFLTVHPFFQKKTGSAFAVRVNSAWPDEIGSRDPQDPFWDDRHDARAGLRVEGVAGLAVAPFLSPKDLGQRKAESLQLN